MTAPPRTAVALARAVRAGESTAAAAVDRALARLDDAAPLGAVVDRDDDGARARARAIDDARARGEDPGPLAGVPVAVKANICTGRLPSTCGSRILGRYVSPFAATAVERLERAGAIIVATANCDEFGMGSTTETSCHGPTRHPRDARRSPGGSSGGSAALVAAGAVPAALGSDTGGSVRQPAAWCGLFGLKPTYGRIPRWGLVAFASSMDQIGPLTPDLASAARLLSVLSGPDGRDMTCAAAAVPDWEAEIERGVAGERVGLLRPAGLDDAVREALDWAAAALAGAGAIVEPVSIDLLDAALAIYHVVASAEASSNLARFDGVRFGRRAAGVSSPRELYERTRGEGFGLEVKRRLAFGTLALSSGRFEEHYGRAIAARAALRRALDDALAERALLLGPVTPGPAIELGATRDDPIAQHDCDRHTVAANLGGHPALAVPAPAVGGALPVGVQLLGRHLAEGSLFRAGRVLELARGAVS